MKYYKFVKWDVKPVENFFNDRIPAALIAYDNGDKKPLDSLQIATTTPFYKIGGWCFPLSDYLRKFWVKTKYYGILEYYAVNKMAIRKELKSDVIKIIEII